MFSPKKTSIRFLFSVSFAALCLLMVNCNDSSPTNTSSHPYSGIWKIVLAGSLTGGGDMNLGTDGKFSDVWTMEVGSNTYQTTITGSVTNAGAVSGDVSISGPKVGTLSGALSGTTGNGTYLLTQPQQLGGIWKATKTSR
jgi:hypothetical protein